MSPYIGAPAIYQDGTAKPRAALIVWVHDDTWVNLVTFDCAGHSEFASNVERGPIPAGRCWDFAKPPAETLDVWGGLGSVS